MCFVLAANNEFYRSDNLLLPPFVTSRETGSSNDMLSEALTTIQDKHISKGYGPQGIFPIKIRDEWHIACGDVRTVSKLSPGSLFIASPGEEICDSNEIDVIKSQLPSPFKEMNISTVKITDDEFLTYLYIDSENLKLKEVAMKLSSEELVWWVMLSRLVEINSAPAFLTQLLSISKNVVEIIDGKRDLSQVKKELFWESLKVVLSENNSVQVRVEASGSTTGAKDSLMTVINEMLDALHSEYGEIACDEFLLYQKLELLKCILICHVAIDESVTEETPKSPAQGSSRSPLRSADGSQQKKKRKLETLRTVLNMNDGRQETIGKTSS